MRILLSIKKITKKILKTLFSLTRFWRTGLLFILILLAVLGYQFFLKSKEEASAGWWNESWMYRKSIAVSNSSGGVLTDFQVKILDNKDLSADITAGKIQSDLDDLRFTDINGNVLPYWIEDATTTSVDVWVKMANIPTTGATAYLYYGNTQATNAQNGNNVFEFFDDFNDNSIDTNKWNVTGNTWSETGGQLEVLNSGTAGVSYSMATTKNYSVSDAIVETKMTPYAVGSSQGKGVVFRYADTSNMYIATCEAWTTARIDIGKRVAGAWSNLSQVDMTGGISVGVPYKQVIKFSSTSFSNIVTNLNTSTTTTTNITDSSHSGSKAVGLIIDRDETSTGAKYDYFFVRKYVSTDPSAGAPATEEKSAGPVGYWSFDEGTGGIANNSALPGGVVATGGTVQDISGYRIHTFTSSGTFTATKAGNVEVLVVGGGGGGGSSSASNGGAGGGGAGGLIYDRAYAVTPGQAITVTVGGGGSPGTTGANQAGTNGTNSVFGSLTAVGGGGGANTGTNGSAGGSGGGGGYNGYAVVRYGGSATAGQGNAGGNTSLLSWAGGAGGGGAGGVGGDNKIDHGGGDRGAGLAYDISGSSVTYAIGGAGGANSPAASPANTGKGGDAAYAAGTAYAGGSGVVIVRYPYGADGTLSNMSSTPSPTSGWQTEDKCVSGKCLAFDGTNDAVNVEDSSNLDFGINDNFTVSVWAKIQNPTTYHSFLGKCGQSNTCPGYEFFMNGTSITFRMTWTGGPLYGLNMGVTKDIRDNKWHNVVAVINRATDLGYIYVDGVQVGGAADISSVGDLNNSSPLTIGTAGAGNFIGLIDEPKIYPYARTATQIKQDYNAGLAGIGTSKGVSASVGGDSPKWMTDGLVGHWKMDEASWGSVVDSSGNGKNGTVAGNAAITVGKYGNGGTFDGTGDYVDVAGDILPVSQARLSGATYSIWVKPNAVNSNQVVLGQRPSTGYSDQASGGINIKSDGSARMVAYDDGVAYKYADSSAGSLTAGRWYFLTGTYDPSIKKLRIYIDGKLAGESGIITTFASLAANAFNGISKKSSNDSNIEFTGSVDDARIYNRALSPQEITDLYNYAPGPVGHWKMDDASGTTAVDSSGGGSTLALSNTSWDAKGKFGGTLSFNGSTSTTSVADNSLISLTNAGTIEAWINSNRTYPSDDGNTKFRNIINKWTTGGCSGSGDGYFIDWNGTSSGGSLRGHICNGTTYQGITYSTTFTPNTWYHVVYSWDGSYHRMYLNGRSVGTPVAQTINNQDDTGILRIGDGFGGGTAYRWDGKIDDVKIYNYARTQKQIVEDMNAGHPAGGSPVGSQVGYWKFDEGYGTTAYNHGNGGSALNGTISGATWMNDGKFGKALSFDGTGDYVNTNVTAPSSGGYTFSVWAKTSDSTTARKAVLGSMGGGRHDIYIDGSTPRCRTWDTSEILVSSSQSVSNGEWVHLVCTMDFTNGGVKLYVNGELQESLSRTPVSAGGLMYVGDSGSTSTNDFNGAIDEVKFYSYALTEDEIKLDYNQGKALSFGAGKSGDVSDDAVSYWKMDESQGSVSDDANGSNNGTLTNYGSSYLWSPGKINGALRFNQASSHYIAISPLQSITGGFTLEALVYKSAQDTGHDDIMSSNNFRFQATMGSTSGFRPYIGFNAALGSAVAYGPDNVSFGAWHHVVATWNGTNGSTVVYVDGVPGTAVTGPTGTLTFTGSRIGSDGLSGIGSYDYFDGYLDEVKFYNYVRSSEQIKADAQADTLNPVKAGAPVAEWKLDEMTGATANDTSGNSRHLAFSNTPSWLATGKVGSALDFDNDDYVSYDWTDFSLVNQTIEFWMKADTINASWRDLVGTTLNTDSNRFHLDATDNSIKWYNYVGAAAVLDSNVIPVAGQWYHVVGTYDGTTVKVYVNGQLKNSASASIASYTATGAWIGGTTEDFDGQIDDVKIYDYARTPAQVAWDYNRGKPVGHWKMDEGEGLTVYDHSGNGNNGTMTNMDPATDWVTGKLNKALDFDGTDDYVEMNAPVSSSSMFTISMWYYPTRVNSSYDMLYSGTDNIDLQLFFHSTTKTLTTSIENVEKTGGLTLTSGNINQWYHIVWTHDNVRRKTYINGELTADDADTTTLTKSDTKVRIGETLGNAYPIQGQIDDVRVYNYALTAEQVEQVMNDGAVNFK